jgi:hypothetical protein
MANVDWSLLETHADGVAFATLHFAKSRLRRSPAR